MEDLGLKRVLGLPSVVFIAVGMTVGGGVFVFTGLVYKISGQALPLAYALAAIPVMVSMFPLAMLGAALPTTGGNYTYPSRMVSPGLAFVGIWVYALASRISTDKASHSSACFPAIRKRASITCLSVVWLVTK